FSLCAVTFRRGSQNQGPPAVCWRFLWGAVWAPRFAVIFSLHLFFLACGLSLPAPVPPRALLCRQTRIARLGHSGAESVEHAGILPLTRRAVQPLVHPFRLLLRQLGHAADAEHLEVAQHGRPDGDQVGELPCGGGHKTLLDFIVRTDYSK